MLKKALDDKIKELAEKESSTPSTSGHRTEPPGPGGRGTYAGAAAAAAPAPTSSRADGDSWYWRARKCLKVFPIEGKTDDELLFSLDQFVLTKLRIPPGTFNRDDIGFIRRVKSLKRTKIPNEVVVSFNSTDARDLVQSYARNLADCVTEAGKPTAGLRMEIPERLIADFKALEQYGHALKSKHKNGFKRHIKLDDSCLGLYLDVFLPKQAKWIRVDVEHARMDNKRRTARTMKKSDMDQLSTCGDSEDESADE